MKIGLVLAGGGARGAYQVGAWKALKELGIYKYVEVISGTSVGALNAVLFMMNNIEFAENIWGEITKEKMLPTNHIELSFREILLKLGMKKAAFIKKYMPRIISGGNISRESLNLIMEKIDLNMVKDNEKTCYVTCTQIPELIPKYFKLNECNLETIKRVLCATSAIPMIYECEKIDEVQYLDGGIVDNVPLQVVYGEHCNIIIIIHLSKESTINKRNFPNTSIIEIIPSVIEEGDFEGTLEFNKDMSKRRMRIGYEDTMSTLMPLMELTRFIDKEKDKEQKIIREERENSSLENKNNKTMKDFIKGILKK